MNTMVKDVDYNLGNYRIPEAARVLQEFVDDISNWYVRRSRERFWAKGMEQDKINAYMTLYTALVTISKAAAPMIPFMTEDIYQNLVCSIDKNAPESIHLCDFPEVHEEQIDKELENNMEHVLDLVVMGRACRNAANIKNRQPIGNMFVKADFDLPEFYQEIVADELNVKNVKFTDDVRDFTSYSFKPQLKTVGPKYGKMLGGIKAALNDIDGNAAMDELNATGALKLDVNGQEIELFKEDLLIDTAQIEGYESVNDNGITVVLDTNLTPELLEEGFVREIISKIQTMRKEADFEVMDRIKVTYEGSEKAEAVFEKNNTLIAGEVLADEVVKAQPAGYVKEWKINGEAVTMGVEKKRRIIRMFSKRFEKKAFKAAVKDNVKTLYRKTIDEATPQQLFQAVSYAVKDVIIDDWIETQKRYDETDAKTVYYMSMEFLMGRALGNNLINMTAYKEVKEALEEMNIGLNVVEDQEPDAALGNGGLGRLAACFLDSLATLNYPAYGCGIRYRYGMFKQKIKDGYQVEVPDNWLKEGNPFEIRREEYAKEVRFGGNIRFEKDPVTGKDKFIQENYESVMAVPYDMPVVGYGNHVVNTLRVWDAKPITDFKLDEFDRGNYHKAVEQENLAKLIVDVLYPNDNHYAGKELRLKQQYFFISASLQALIAKYKKKHGDIRKLYEKVVIQMNDTHPTVAVPELMRLLIDVEGLSWEDAWEVTSKTCAYTNHTIMAEALEKWPIDLFSKLLPRIYQIVQEIDRRFLIKVREMYPGNEEKVRKMAILMNGQVRMANMAIVAGFSVNGVAQLHTEILEKQELRDFYEMFPEKFNNKTNGITQRRFLAHGNPLLADWITDKIGDGWITDLSQIAKAETTC